MIQTWQRYCPSWIDLAHLPTPLQPLPRLSERFNLPIHIKRDDLTGAELSGNKVRKLEFVMAEAVAQKADTVLTCGGAQSNHARATAVAAARLGLRCCLLLRTENPSQPPPLQGNILLERMAGAEILWITPDEYRQRDQVFAHQAARLRQAGRKPHIIPEGASNALGAMGYVRAAFELAADLAGLGQDAGTKTTIVHATGSGGTAAGLILGAKLAGLDARVASINVCDDRDYFVDAIGAICEKAIAQYELPLDFDRARDIEVIDGYVGRGYGLSRPQELALICEVARSEGIFFDPVYTGKAFYGMAQEFKKRPDGMGERVVFIHTGGIFSLFAPSRALAAAVQGG